MNNTRQIQLWDEQLTEPINLLSRQGIAHYYGCVLSLPQADGYLKVLQQKIAFKPDQAVVYDKHIVTRREVAWYGDEPFEYTYSNTTKRALPWVEELLALKFLVQQTTGETFNSCLLNLYHDGSEGMAWHSDAELDLKPNGAIASLSFGAERKFAFKHKQTKKTASLMLQHGSLLVMKGETQTHWLHSLPVTKKVSEPRINLTFRTIVNHS